MQRVPADELDIEGIILPLQRMIAHDNIGAHNRRQAFLTTRKASGISRSIAPSTGPYPRFSRAPLSRRRFSCATPVRNFLQFGFEAIDLGNERAKPFDFTLVFRADKLFNDKPIM